MTESEVAAGVSEEPTEQPRKARKASLSSLFSLFFKRESKSLGLTGVGITTEGICLTHVDKYQTQPLLEVCDYKACYSKDERPGVLNALVNNHGLKNTRCTTVMDPGSYTLHLVDAPNVEPGEMHAAIRWRVKELIDYPVDEAVVDVFDVPGRNLRGPSGRMIYVVVAHISEVKKRIELVEGAGLKLDIIDIPEMALRNIAGLLQEDGNGVAMLHISQYGGLITLTRQGTLYLARNINTGVDRLQRLRVQEIGAQGENTMGQALRNAMDGIVLEIQRSLDYYERHCSNPPIGTLVVTSIEDEIPGFLEYISRGLGVEVKTLQLGSYLQSFLPLHDSMLRNSLYTIGAALRDA